MTFAYTRFGAVATAATSGVITHTYSYNSSLQESSDAMTTLLTRTLTRTYSAADVPNHVPAGRPTGMSIGSEYTVAYGYDISGRLNNVRGPGLPGDGSAGTGAVYKFIEAGPNNPLADLVSKIDFNATGPSTVATTLRSFEPQRDLITHIDNKWGGTTVSKYTYANDALARRTSVVMLGTGAGGDRFIKFAYDDRNELTEARWYNGTNPSDTSSPITTRQFTYTFDCIGNRTTDAGDPGVTSYTANNLNQYTATAGPDETFTYDDDGNLTADGTLVYVWDAENRLAEMRKAAPAFKALKAFFKYDHMGRRVRKTTYPTFFNGTAWEWSTTPNVDRKFIYDGWNLLMELDALSTQIPEPAWKYTWGLDLSGLSGSVGVPPASISLPGLHGAGGIGGLLAMRDASAGVDYIYFLDANGNVCQLANSSTGVLVAQYEYYPYGGELAATGPAKLINPIRFSTKYWDAGLSVYYYGHRYLRSKMGRWLSRDPIHESGGNNLYATSRNDPTDLVDPLGLAAKPNNQCTINTVPISLHFDGAKLSGSGIEIGAVSGRPTNVLNVGTFIYIYMFAYSPEREKIKNVGPIPTGSYWIDSCEERDPSKSPIRHVFGSDSWGSYSWSLHPYRDNPWTDRSGFFIHGGDKPGSAGCIDVLHGDKILHQHFASMRSGDWNTCCCYVPVHVHYTHRHVNVITCPDCPPEFVDPDTEGFN